MLSHMRKIIPLMLICFFALSIGIVYGQTTYERGTIFESDAGGGNITFAHNITATTFTNAVANQARFTQLHMLGNGTWANLGFRNANNNNTMNITQLGTRHISFDAIIETNTILEVYLPGSIGRPDTVTGGGVVTWTKPTLFITMTGDDTVILEWDLDPTGISDSIDLSIDIMITMFPLIVLMFAVSLVELGRMNYVSNRVVLYALVVAVVAIILGIYRALGI